MTRSAFVVGPSRKPEFWAAVERHKKAEGKKPEPDHVPAAGKKIAAKKAAKKAKKGGRK